MDGWLDFGYSASANSASWHRVYRNIGVALQDTFAFSEKMLPHRVQNARGMASADWNGDGFTELMIAATRTSTLFYRDSTAVDGTNTNNFVGIRLTTQSLGTNDPYIMPCNTWGIGATVIVTAGDHVQAQIVDGGSGHVGQSDLELSFVLGAYTDSVDVKVIWPCGQTQYERLPSGQYNTVTLGWPDVVPASVKGYLEWTPGMPTVAWVFEWETTGPSNAADDRVTFPQGVMDGPSQVFALDGSRTDVELADTHLGTGNYQHLLKWLSRPCDQTMTVVFQAHSSAVGQDYTHTKSKKLTVLACPQS